MMQTRTELTSLKLMPYSINEMEEAGWQVRNIVMYNGYFPEYPHHLGGFVIYEREV